MIEYSVPFKIRAERGYIYFFFLLSAKLGYVTYWNTGTEAWQLFVLGGQNSNTDRPAAWGTWAGYPVYRLTAEVPCLPPECVSGWLWMKLAKTGRWPVLQRIWGMCTGRVNTAPPPTHAHTHSNLCSLWFPPPQLTSVHMCRQEFTDCCLLAWFASVSDKGLYSQCGWLVKALSEG